MNNNAAISFYVDTIIVETVLGNSQFIKTAESGLLSNLLSKVKDYIGSHIDKNDKVGSLENLLAPGLISIGFRALGLPWIGMFFGLAASMFHFDLASLISSIWSTLKGMMSGNKEISSQHIDTAVKAAVDQHIPSTDTSQADFESKSFENKMRDALMVRASVEKYEKQILRLTNNSIIKDAGLLGKPAIVQSLLSKILGWIFKIGFASAGLLVAGDALNKFVGRPNSFDGTYQEKIGPAAETAAPATPNVNQTKFPFKSDSVIPDEIPLINNSDNISKLIIQWAKDVYSGLDGKELLIENTVGFKIIKQRMEFYNQKEGIMGIYVPPNFTSKKQLTDLFIADVAKAS